MEKPTKLTDPDNRAVVVEGRGVKGQHVECVQAELRAWGWTPNCQVAHLRQVVALASVTSLKKRTRVTLHAKNTAWQIN